jgi:rare lipoprotein A
VPSLRSPGNIDPGRDGPEAAPPGGLDRVPDAAPRVEPIRSGGPNKPYEVFGREYVPFTQDRAFRERGLASWYGRKFQGRPTASGEIYDMYAMTAAHPTLPIPSYARVRNPANGREIIVRVNDRGPFHPGRIIDLSYTAALKLDLLRGVAPVEVERITYEDIRPAHGVAIGVPIRFRWRRARRS